MKKSIIFSLAILFFASCSDKESINNEPEIEQEIPNPDTNKLQSISLSQSESEIMAGEVNFAIRLLGECCDSFPGDGYVISPYSVNVALSLLANGTSGETLNEITNLLGVPNGDIEALNSLNIKLTDKLLTLDKQTEIKTANSIWVDPAYQFQEQYANTLANCYGASTHSVDFSTQAGVDIINAWVYTNTDNKIDKFIDAPKNGHFMLINAICFEGKWYKKFNEKLTSERVFTSDNGDIHNVKTMLGKELYGKYYNDLNTEAIILPYGNWAYRMNIILPSKDKAGEYTPINDFVKSFTYEKWILTRKALSSTMDLYLPRFSMEAKTDLAKLLIKMGIPKAFEYSGDINRMLSGVSPNELAVAHVRHAATIGVNEAGSKAQAATSVEDEEIEDSVIRLTIDRPFMFVIDEVSTGAILFAGVVRDIPQ